MPAFECYQQGKPVKSLELLQTCLSMQPNDKVIQIYIERCRENMKNGNNLSQLTFTKFDHK